MVAGQYDVVVANQMGSSTADVKFTVKEEEQQQQPSESSGKISRATLCTRHSTLTNHTKHATRLSAK